MIRLISTRFEVPMARLMEMPDNGFSAKVAPCRSIARKITAPNRMEREAEIIATTAMTTAFFFRTMPSSDELVAACAPMMAESCHISVGKQAEDCMSALLPNLKRWRRQDEIDAVAEGE